MSHSEGVHAANSTIGARFGFAGLSIRVKPAAFAGPEHLCQLAYRKYLLIYIALIRQPDSGGQQLMPLEQAHAGPRIVPRNVAWFWQ